MVFGMATTVAAQTDSAATRRRRGFDMAVAFSA
jgi:hypothetical protein